VNNKDVATLFYEIAGYGVWTVAKHGWLEQGDALNTLTLKNLERIWGI